MTFYDWETFTVSANSASNTTASSSSVPTALYVGIIAFAIWLLWALVPIVGSSISLYHSLKEQEKKNSGLIATSIVSLACAVLSYYMRPLLLMAIILMFITLFLDTAKKRAVSAYVVFLVIIAGATFIGIFGAYTMIDAETQGLLSAMLGG